MSVALFTRAWIEICASLIHITSIAVALFTRAWIEIRQNLAQEKHHLVALFTRAWIEIVLYNIKYLKYNGRPFHEGVD